MTSYDMKTMKLVEILNDLAWVHSDRIDGYQQAVKQLTNIDADLREEYCKIIIDGQSFKQQLLQRVNDLIGGTGKYSSLPVFGKIYRAWMDLKTPFSGSTHKVIISSCQYNEEITLHVYRAALNVNIEMANETRQLIEKHEGELRKEYERIKKYREAPHTIDYRTLYYA
jgi:uncharacterized protein (TIGR02284 family)